jgi:hypothetical protein
MNMKKLGFIFFASVLIACSTYAQKISPALFGQNHWIDSYDEGSRIGYVKLLWPKVKESGIKTVRIGGAGYDSKLPEQARLVGIIDSIYKIGAEPILQVPSHYTAEEATKLVRFFNKNPKRRPVKYWSIGNEPLLRVREDHEAMMKKLDEVYQYLMRLAPAMKAADPKMKILVFDEAGLRNGNSEKLNYEAYEALCGGRLDITGKDKKGNWMVDGINFHLYPNRLDYSRDHLIFASTYSVRLATSQILGLIEKANKLHGRTGDARLIWGMTEVNVNAGNPNREVSGVGCPSFLGGQFIAEMYGNGMKNGAFTVCPWCISETDNNRTDFGYLGAPSEFYPRSSYYHTQMMAFNIKGEFLPTESSNSYVKTIASKSDDEVCIMILNEDQNHDFEFDIILNKTGVSSKSLTVIADAGIDKTISGMIPNQTTMMFVLSKTGEIKKQYTYGLTQNMKNLPPEVKEIKQ